MTIGLYKGFSSFQFEYNKSFTLLDVAIVKRDLLNHFFTRLGERVMMPQFGIRIPILLMEPLDDNTLDIIYQDTASVIDFDPRVELIGDISVIPDYDNSKVTVSAFLNYIELNLQDQFDINLVFVS